MTWLSTTHDVGDGAAINISSEGNTFGISLLLPVGNSHVCTALRKISWKIIHTKDAFTFHSCKKQKLRGDE